MARGDKGINPLDSACKEHDIAYASSKDTTDRYLADTKLEEEAMRRFAAKDASFGERATALGVAVAMKAKRALTKKGKGLGKRYKKKRKNTQRVAFNTLVRHARAEIKKSKPTNVEAAVRVAIEAVKRSRHGKQIRIPRIIKIPQRLGGALPLIPIFTSLNALGSIVGGVKGIVNAINYCMHAKNKFSENKTTDAIAIGNHKRGKGFFMHADKSGSSLYLSLTSAKNQ